MNNHAIPIDELFQYLEEHAPAAASPNSSPVRADQPVPEFDIVVDPDAVAPADKLAELLAADPRAKVAWDDIPDDRNDKSTSSYDFSFALAAAKAGWEPQEIVNGIIQRRRERAQSGDENYNDDEKIHRVDYLRGTIQKAIAEAHKSRKPEKRKIQVNHRPFRKIARDVLQVLGASNVPVRMFVQDGRLVRVTTNSAGLKMVELLNPDKLRHEASIAADFVKVAKNGEETYVSPPGEIIRELLANITRHRGWQSMFPVLNGIARTPSVRADGSILDEIGYDPKTGLYFDPSSRTVRSVSDKPNNEELEEALDMLHDVFIDFPVLSDPDYTNLFAFLITPFLRDIINGPVPMVVIVAPEKGTGKTLLARIVSIICTGEDPAIMTAPAGEAEWSRQITSVLRESPSIVIIDNVVGTLSSAKLAAALTSVTWKDRLLGKSLMLELPQRAAWVATGNNVTLGGDLPRRCYLIRMDAQVTKPWERDDFKHPDLISYVKDHRQDLVWAVQTLIRSWFASGRPKADVPAFGSYEEWTAMVGGILHHVGLRGFLQNRSSVFEFVDESGAQWAEFLGELRLHYGHTTFTTRELFDLISRDDYLEDLLPDDLSIESPKTLGYGLRQKPNTRFGPHNVRLIHSGKSGQGVNWRVEIDE